ncbi:MAG: TRAP transporter substrate-binding protein DctP [Deltaproteobacteria bacterium]|nr:TRAP transporter substrate-binding protein DctP [Deltaproteobacteria bacterium]
MKKALRIVFICLLVIAFMATVSMAADKKARQKFGIDKRHAEISKLKMSTSAAKVTWKMVMPWSKGLLFYDIAQHFADSVYVVSGGRFTIKVFSAGELVPAMQSFDAVSKGSAECGHDWPGYWQGKDVAFNAFASLPFGLDNEGYNIWFYEYGGDKQMDELYGRWNMRAWPCGNVGQELGLNSNKRASKMADFKGMRIRTVGVYMDILNRLGASVSPLPGGEIYLALERGVVDSAEFSSPAINYPMGFDDICKYVIVPGVHQPSCQSAFFANKDAYNKLADDLKWIIDICCRETQLWSNHWIENLNTKAIQLFQKKQEFVKMDDATVVEFAKTSFAYLDELAQKSEAMKKALETQYQFRKDFAPWREMRSGVAPWPKEDVLAGKLYQ